MPIQIGQSTGHGFDQPLGLLSDCHRRIEHFLAVLVAVLDRAAGDPLTPAIRRELEAALTYFATAAPKHTADEEESLFPRLKATTTSTAATRDVLAELERDHEEADRHHHAVDAIGRQWLADGSIDREWADALRGHLDRLRAIYERHIAIEDHQLFPAAAAALSPDDLRAVGREMAARRSVVPAVTPR
jgi:hemerythrin-like domain-containing protein